MSTPPSRSHAPRLGCGFLLLTGMVMIGLLVMNVFFVQIFLSYSLLEYDNPIFQAMQFTIPILMVFIEFWIYDRLTLRKKKND